MSRRKRATRLKKGDRPRFKKGTGGRGLTSTMKISGKGARASRAWRAKLRYENWLIRQIMFASDHGGRG